MEIEWPEPSPCWGQTVSATGNSTKASVSVEAGEAVRVGLGVGNGLAYVKLGVPVAARGSAVGV
jgi:hypothetical protein